MSYESVCEYLDLYGLKEKVHHFDVSSATVELAARAVGCEPKRIAKTMSFKLGDQCVLIVTAGDTKVNNQKFKALFATKPKMLSPEEVTELTGHMIGGVCPFDLPDGVTVYLDNSLRRFQTVFPAAGSPDSAVEVTLEQLEEASGAIGWADVCSVRN